MLGNFYTILNLLGCVGKLLAGIVLSTILAEKYGESTVNQMLSGKAYSRALRGHLIVDQVVSVLLFEKITEESSQYLNSIIDNLEILHNNLLLSMQNISDLSSDPLLSSIYPQMKDTKSKLTEKSRTASLWLQYEMIIEVIRKLITADRIGNWDIHLQAIQHALPIFAASGHFNYVKSGYLYLQNMLNLKTSNEVVYNHLKKRNFVVRRSARYWAGLPCDLIIEQVLMRSLKTTGGLTRGAGMSEIMREIWLLSNSICSMYRLTMEENIGVLFKSSEHHKTSRINRDHSDRIKIYDILKVNSPFSNDLSWRNIIDGITAPKSVNVNTFYEIGEGLFDKMQGCDIYSFAFSRKNQAKNMTTKITLDKENNIKCDPAFLFQRVLLAAQ